MSNDQAREMTKAELTKFGIQAASAALDLASFNLSLLCMEIALTSTDAEDAVVRLAEGIASYFEKTLSGLKTEFDKL